MVVHRFLAGVPTEWDRDTGSFEPFAVIVEAMSAGHVDRHSNHLLTLRALRARKPAEPCRQKSSPSVHVLIGAIAQFGTH